MAKIVYNEFVLLTLTGKMCLLLYGEWTRHVPGWAPQHAMLN